MPPRGICRLPSGRSPCSPPFPTPVDCLGGGVLLDQQHPSHFPLFFSFPQSFGFSLLACSNYHWQLSFLRAEQVLLEQLDEDGGCRRKCFQALRQMKEDVWCPGKRPVITSHHLQVSARPGIEAQGGCSWWVPLLPL